MLALLYAASQPDRVPRLAVMAAPVDWSHMGPLVAMTRHGRLEPEELFDTGNVPAAAMKNGFIMLQPTAKVAGYASLLQHLDNDAFVEQFRAVGAWVDEHVPFPGACFADLTRALGRDNTLVSMATPLGDRTVDLANITSPLLCVVADKDHICPPAAAEAVLDLIGSEHGRLVRIPAGHIGLIISRTASEISLPALVDWLTIERGGTS